MSAKTNRSSKKKPPKTSAQSAETRLFDEVRVGRGPKQRKLTDEERMMLIQLMALKGRMSTDLKDVAPPGSFIAMILRHFKATDISYALPFMGLLSVAASRLTQMNASVAIPGVGNIRPTLWNCLLASSGSAKTLGLDELFRILSEPDEREPVEMLPIAGSDAQWIIELENHNGAFWFQDEVGKYFRKLSRDSNFARMKPWLLDAYSHKSISNNLKKGQSTYIEDPHFSFLGMTVTETWANDIDADSMLDGFAQRFGYIIAPPRTDRDIFDFLLYFEGEHVDARRADMREIWRALCAQEGANGPYELNDEVLPYLREWWGRLRNSWGKTAVPGSFMRRIGFSLFRYLPVVHFLLGKCRWKIDVETAEICTRICEAHFQSVLDILDNYSPESGSKVRKIAAIREDIISKVGAARPRDVSRRLSAAQRKEFPRDLVAAIMDALDKIEAVPDLIDADMTAREKSEALVGRYDEIAARLTLNTRKRNERRMREVMRAYRVGKAVEIAARSDPQDSDAASATGSATDGEKKVVQAKTGWSILDDIEDETDDVIDHQNNVYQLPLPFAVR